MITPRDLLVETWLTRVPLIIRAGDEVKVLSLCLELINMNSILAMFNASLFAITHFPVSVKSPIVGSLN